MGLHMRESCVHAAEILVMLLFLTDANAQWVQTNGPHDANGLAANDTRLVAFSSDSGVFLSTNNGLGWTSINSGLPSQIFVNCFAFKESRLFAGTTGYGVFVSTNNGTYWSAVNSGLTSTIIYSLAVRESSLFAAGYGVFRSTDDGANWTPAYSGLGGIVSSLALNATNIFAGTYYGIFRSTNNGTSWTGISSGLPPNPDVQRLVAVGTTLFAKTPSRIFRTTNDGNNWTLSLQQNASCLAVSGPNLFVGTSGSGVFLSTNNGISWASVNLGLPHLQTLSLAVNEIYLFAALPLGGVWRRPLNEMITSMRSIIERLPKGFSLDQNYPNPFNPTTTITFSVQSKSFASLKVLDELGREVSVLISEELPAGTYSQKWNAEGLASGVYFYRLQAGNFVETKKLLLLR